jgi:hypothetical protein
LLFDTATGIKAGMPNGIFLNQKSILSKFWRVLESKMLVYFMAIWYIFLLSFGIFYGHLVYFMVIWYTCWSFGIFFPFWYVLPRKIWQLCQ